MRIVHYHPRTAVGDGGITNSVKNLSAALVRQGHQAVIIHDRGAHPGIDNGVEWINAPHIGPEGARVPLRMGRVLDGADILVLNSAWTAHNVRAGRVARRMGIPYVLAPRGAYDPALLERRRRLKQAWWATLERPLVEGADAMHIFFRSEQPHLKALGFRGAFLVAPNGVAVPQGYAWDGGSGGYVLYMGRFDPEHKGIDLLVRAVGELHPGNRPLVRLHGPDWRGGKTRVIELIRELDLEQWVTVGPAVYGREKWELLSRAKGFAYPSRWEGFGNSLAEAAALGVPCLATPYPLAAHLAERGGAFVKAADASSLAEGLNELRSSAAKDVGERAAEVVNEELTWEAVARRWLVQVTAMLKDGT